MTNGALVAGKQNQVLRAFGSAGATRPELAKTPEEAGCRDSLALQSLVRRKVLVPVGGGRYWLDSRAAEAFRKQRRAIMFGVLLLVIAGVLILVSVK